MAAQGTAYTPPAATALPAGAIAAKVAALPSWVAKVKAMRVDLSAGADVSDRSQVYALEIW